MMGKIEDILDDYDQSRCIRRNCEGERASPTVVFCQEHLEEQAQRAVERNEQRKEIAKDKQCIYCGETGDSGDPDKRNLVPIPNEHHIGWIHQGCVQFE